MNLKQYLHADGHLYMPLGSKNHTSSSSLVLGATDILLPQIYERKLLVEEIAQRKEDRKRYEEEIRAGYMGHRAMRNTHHIEETDQNNEFLDLLISFIDECDECQNNVVIQREGTVFKTKGNARVLYYKFCIEHTQLLLQEN